MNRNKNQKKKEGVVVVGSGYKYLSGISYYTAELANNLNTKTTTSLVLIKNLCPKIIYPGKDRIGKHNLEELNIDPSVKIADTLNWYLGYSFFKTLHFIRKQNPEYMLLSWWTGTSLHYYILLALWAKIHKINTTLEFHEILDVSEAKIPLVKPYVKFGFKILEKIGFNAVTHSSMDKKRIIDELGLKNTASSVVHIGPMGLIKNIQKNISNENKVNILYFGVIRDYKGVDILLKAYKKVLEENSNEIDINLTVAGEVWENKKLIEDLVATIPYEKITFIDKYLDEKEVEILFSKANLIVLPYRRSSASGPLHMALASNLRVITSDVESLVEATHLYSGVDYFRNEDVDHLAEKILENIPKSHQTYPNPYTWDLASSNYIKALGKGYN